MKKILSLFAAVLFAGSMMATDLLNVDFTKGKGNWTIADKVLPGDTGFVWAEAGNYGMKATAYYENAAHAAESWLISPAIDMSGATSATMTINQALNKGKNTTLAVKASTDGQNWANVALSEWPAGTSWTYSDATADLTAYAGNASVQIAFVYVSTTDNCPTWEIKTVVVADGDAPAPADVTFLPSDFTGQGTDVTGGEVTATKDGVTFLCNKGYGAQSLKCYKGSRVSITSTTEQIGKLKFKFYSTYTGGLAEEIVVNAQEWKVDSMTAQARFDKIEVFFGEYDTIPTPPVEDPDTITVAKALEIGKALADKAVTPKEYVIKGYSCDIAQKFDTTFKNETFWISDTKGTRTSDKAAAFYVYRCKPNTAAEIGLDALIQIKCKIKNYSGTIENDGTNIEFEVLEQGVIEIPDTISVADAIALAQNLTPSTKDNKYPTEKSYVIKGYVSEIVDYYDTQYKNETFWVTDEKGQRTSDKNLAFEVYRGKPNPAGEVGLDAYVQFTCKIINFGGTVENYDSNMEVKVLEPGKPVVIDTVTVAEALEIGNALADNAYTDNPYVVIGYVTKAYEPDSGYTSQNFYMADDPDARGEFYAYRSKPDAKINQGDYVQLFGKIQKYVGTKGTTIELSYGTATHVEAPKLDTLTVAEVQALNLAEGATTEERYIILAYVAEVTSPYEDDLESFILSDDAAATAGALNCIDAEIAAPGAALHDYVKVVGKISKVNGAFRMVGAKAYNLTRQDIQNIVLTEKAQKIMVDGVIYIIRDSKIYNLQGTRVR